MEITGSEKPETFSIPKYNLVFVEKKIGQLNRVAQKLGCVPVEIVILREFTETITREESIVEEIIPMLEIRIDGTAPQINGWEFIATLQPIHHSEKTGMVFDGNIIRKVPSKSIGDLAKYRHIIPACEHCQTKRLRKEVFLVRNVENGEIKMVGRNCLQDFLGHVNPEVYAKFAESLWNLEFISRWGEKVNPVRYDPVYDFRGYLAQCCWSVRKRGWISRARAMDESRDAEISTADDAWYWYHFKPSRSKESREMFNDTRPEPKDHDQAELIIAWVWENVLEKKHDSDFMHNLKVAFSDHGVTYRTKGLVAAAVICYLKATRPREKKDYTTSEFVGEVGKRQEFTLTIGKLVITPSGYGERYTYLMEDENGNRFVWFASKDAEMDEGSTYVVKATVKKHDKFKNIKQTYITRGTVVRKT